uniref:Pentatricopeptide repeat-containing protein At2g30100, chloroplastic n=1 Tax=Anthurium amnicola TaxID=1678845 RepID=A0A1D1Y7M8_9ARAE
MALPSPVGSSCVPFSSVSARSRRGLSAALPLRRSCSPRLPIRSTRTPPRLKAPGSVRLDRVLTADEEDEVGDGFLEAVDELERMVRDPSDVLGEMVERLSVRELQLVLVHFSQEGRDAYCALEVFDWLRRENRVDGETMELMVSIACGWIERLIGEGHAVEDVVGLLNEMDCVGLEPGFSMVEKVISLYWDMGKQEEAVVFVKDVMRRGGIGNLLTGDEHEDGKRGLVGYLAWKMMADGKYLNAVKLVIDFRECGLKPEVYSYIVALTALVKEQKEFSKSLRKLRGSIKIGMVADLDPENLNLIEQYQSDLLRDGVCLSEWAMQEGSSTISGIVHERLLALYTWAGCGSKAEEQLWEMKLSGKALDRELYDIILAICASQNEDGAVSRLLAGMEVTGAGYRKNTLLWLLRGYVKGENYVKASETLSKMLDVGMLPGYLDRAAVLQGLRRIIQEYGSVEPYVKLCKRLSDMDLVGPCLVYFYINQYNLWVMKML